MAIVGEKSYRARFNSLHVISDNLSDKTQTPATTNWVKKNSDDINMENFNALNFVPFSSCVALAILLKDDYVVLIAVFPQVCMG